MRKSACLLASGIALGLAAPVMAQEPAENVPFIDYAGVGFAIADVDGLDSGTALVVNAGKNLRGLPGVAIEGEFTSTLTKPEKGESDLSYWTVGGYGVYTVSLAQEIDVRGRLGIAYENVDGDGPDASDDDDEVNISGGVGANFNFAKNMAVTVDYTRIEEDINHYGLGVRFGF